MGRKMVRTRLRKAGGSVFPFYCSGKEFRSPRSHSSVSCDCRPAASTTRPAPEWIINISPMTIRLVGRVYPCDEKSWNEKTPSNKQVEARIAGAGNHRRRYFFCLAGLLRNAAAQEDQSERFHRNRPRPARWSGRIGESPRNRIIFRKGLLIIMIVKRLEKSSIH